MQEIQAKVTQAQVEIIDRERFEQGINEVVAKYKLQLELYSRAIEAIFKKPVAEKYLYLFSNNSSIRVK